MSASSLVLVGQENKEAAGPPFMLVTVREVGWRGAEVEPGQGSWRPAKVVACRIKAESTEVKITGTLVQPRLSS